MDAVVAFIANGEATKPVEPGERALDDPAEHAKAAAVGRAARRSHHWQFRLADTLGKRAGCRGTRGLEHRSAYLLLEPIGTLGSLTPALLPGTPSCCLLAAKAL